MSARADRSATWGEPLATLRGWFLFAREALANPREIGAVVPSSPRLARQMARMANLPANALVVELGAGTGVVTEALLGHGVSPDQLVAVELSPALTKLLHERFPSVHVICGDAANLRRLLRRTGLEVGHGPTTIVSSLPLRSLPPAKVGGIVREVSALVRPGGCWIQYTYALAQRRLPPGFQRRQSAVVWRNVPPARVDVFVPDPSR